VLTVSRVNGTAVPLVMSAESGDELLHPGMTAKAMELLGGFHQGRGGPAKNHLAIAPAAHAAAELAYRADQVLDCVGRHEGALQRLRQSEAHHRQRLIEALLE
jgi:hypothetical protein